MVPGIGDPRDQRDHVYFLFATQASELGFVEDHA